MSTSPAVNERCQRRLKWVSKPGIYAEQKSKYPIESCLKCRHCSTKRSEYLNLLAIVVFAVAISVVAMALTYYFDDELYLVLAAPVLVFIFVITSWLAPPESIWQTVGWICVKAFEKCLWSIFAILQAGQFAQWSRKMALDNPNLDAWVYLAIVPIIMNAFMFFMFSRISRLKIPCLTTKYRQRLDSHVSTIDEYQPLSEDIPLAVRDDQASNQPPNDDYIVEDNKYPISAASNAPSQASIVSKEKAHSSAAAVVPVADQSLLSSLSSTRSPSHSRQQSSDKDVVSPPHHSSSNEASVPNEGSIQSTDSVVGFNKLEALKVGIIYMLIINLILYAIAAILLAIKGSASGVGILFATMIGVPLFCSVTMIYVFSYIIDHRINMCPCLSPRFSN